MSDGNRLKIGDRSHRLELISTPAGTRGWVHVRCDCGNELHIPMSLFLTGKKRSCGCAAGKWKKVDAMCSYCKSTYLRQSNHTKSTYCSRVCRMKAAEIAALSLRRSSVEQTLRGIAICSKARCKRKGRDYNISAEYLIDLFREQAGICALSGREMVASQSSSRKNSHPNTVSVDRIDSAGGYTIGNVRLVTTHCNIARSNFTDEQFIELCRDIVRHSERGSQEGTGP